MFSFRSIFTSIIQRKVVLLVLDQGSSLNGDQLDLTKHFGIKDCCFFFKSFLLLFNILAEQIISLLSDIDEIGIISTSDKFSTYFINTDDMGPTKLGKHKFKMYSATMDNKLYLKRFINNLNGTKEMTNHSLAFHNAFTLLHDMQSNHILQHSVPIQMIYISRGLVSPLAEAKNVLEAIANGQRSLHIPVIIDTCAIVLGKYTIYRAKSKYK